MVLEREKRCNETKKGIKMAKPANHGTRIKARMETLGWVFEKTEHWVSFHGCKGKITSQKVNGVRKDLFGFIDYLALDPKTGDTIGVQVTSKNCLSGHMKKIKTECRDKAVAWLQCGNRIEVWAYGKIATRKGGPKTRWDLRVKHVTLDDFMEGEEL